MLDRIANTYFTSDVDAKNRVRSLNEYNKINLNEMGRNSMQDDGFFKVSQQSDHEFGDEIACIDGQSNKFEWMMNDDNNDNNNDDD